MELTRKQVLDNLSSIMDSMPDDACGEWRDSLAYAIADVKLVSRLSNYDLIKPIDYEGIYIKLSDLQDYIHEVENGRTKQKTSN